MSNHSSLNNHQNLFEIQQEEESFIEDRNLIENEQNQQNEQNQIPNYNQEMLNNDRNQQTNDRTNIKHTTKKFKILNKKRGRNSKKIRTDGKEHNKYSNDNVLQKIKYLIIKSLREHINKQIIKRKNNSSQKILTTKPDQIKNTKVLFNKQFLDKTVEKIFSEKLSSKCRKYSPEHNKKLIFNLINTGKEEDKIYFKNIFNLKFIDCLKHFRKEEEIEELKGMALIDDVIKDCNDKEYKDVLIGLTNEYKDYVNNRIEKKMKPKLLKLNKCLLKLIFKKFINLF